MTKYTKVSIGVKKDICAVLITTDGVLQKKRVERIRDEHTLTSNYLTLIYAFTLSLRMIRDYTQTSDEEYRVVFEVNNSTFIKWVDKGFTKDAYQKEFIEMIDLLNELPILYDIIFAQRTMAYNYADAKYLTKDKVDTNLNLEDTDEEDTNADEETNIDFKITNPELKKLSGLDI
jgi:hypothetical protein